VTAGPARAAPGRWARSWAAVLCCLLVSGCLPIIGGSDGTDSAPRAGQCRDTPQAVLPEAHDPTPPVDCTERHTLETYAVLRADGALDGGRLDAMGERCVQRVQEFLGGDYEPTAVSVYYFGPSRAQRAEGARWVRCDVGVVTDTAFAGVRRLTGSLQDAFADGVPPAYRRCLRSSPDPVAPQPLVSCRQPHFAQQMPTSVDLEQADAAYPGMDRLAERAQAECARTVRAQLPEAGQALVVVPTAAMWRAGVRTAQCWATAAPGEQLNDSEAQPA
jgi:hypothetical protein